MRVFALAAAAVLSASAQDNAAVSVLAFGANPNGADPGGTTAAFAAAFAANVNGKIIVPPGEYLIRNKSGALLVYDFSGELEFQGGARLVFTDNSRGGLWFLGGHGARITGLRATYQVPPTRRNSPQEQIKFSSTFDTILNDSFVTNSPAAGILFYDCVRPKVTNATIQDSLADGLHFANCQDAQAFNITAINTGDDGLAFVNYAAYPDRTGGLANNITVRNSGARGITVVGQSDVVISGFLVDGTSSSGLLCAQDTSFDTRIPANVRFSAGIVKNAGTANTPVGNTYGIEYYNQASCSFSDIQVLNAAGRGLAGMAPDGAVTVNNVTVRKNASGEAFSFYRTASVNISNSTADSTPAYGFFFSRSGSVIAKGLTAIDSSQASDLRRAIWFENNDSVLASDLTVADSQNKPTGYVIGAYQANGSVQSGLVNGITAKIANGALVLQTNSEGLVIRNLTAVK